MQRLGEKPVPDEPIIENNNDEPALIEEIIIPADPDNSMGIDSLDSAVNPLAVSFDSPTASTFVASSPDVSVCELQDRHNNPHNLDSTIDETHLPIVASTNLNIERGINDDCDGDGVQLFATAVVDIHKNYAGNVSVTNTVALAPDQKNDQNASSSEISGDNLSNTIAIASDPNQESVQNASSSDVSGNILAVTITEQSGLNDLSSASNGEEPNEHCFIVEIKPENSEILPIFEIRANNDEILEQLEERCIETLTIDGDTIEMTYVASKGFGKPLNSTSDGRIKLEEPDAVSGMIPFITTVSSYSYDHYLILVGVRYIFLTKNIIRQFLQKSGRAYKLGEAYHEIPMCIFKRYSELNKTPTNENAFFDKGLVTSVLLATVNTDQLIDEKIPDFVTDFIEGT